MSKLKGDSLVFEDEFNFENSSIIYPSHPISVDLVRASWSYSLRYATGYVLLPLLIMLSKLLKRKIEW